MKKMLLRRPRNWLIIAAVMMVYLWGVITIQARNFQAAHAVYTAESESEPAEIIPPHIATPLEEVCAIPPPTPYELQSYVLFIASAETYDPKPVDVMDVEYETTVSPPPDFPMPTSDNLAIVWNFFRERGFSPQATAAIIGNLQIESHDDIRPTAEGDEGASRGIAQWNRGRLANLQNHAQQHGRDWLTLDAQLDFMLHELMTGQNVQWWRTTAETGKAGIECFMYAVCVVAAAVALSQAYHRPGIPHMGESGGTMRGRIPRSEAALERFYGQTR